MENIELKPLDVRAIDYVERMYQETGFAPSLAETAEALGMSKGSVIADAFKRLEAAGRIVYREDRKAYTPANWRELASGGLDVLKIEMPADFDIEKLRGTGGVIVPQDNTFAAELMAERERREIAEAELEQIKEKARARYKAWQERTGGKRKKK